MKKLELFLDQDGVFSDFHEGLLRMCGVDLYEKIADKEEHKKRQEYIGYRIWCKPFFWMELKPLPGAIEFYKNFAPYTPKMLTAVPWTYQLKSFEAVTAGEEKRGWVRANLGREQADAKGRFNCTKSNLKHEFCRAKENPDTLYVLIDDSPMNIKDWEAAGGIGIHHDTWGRDGHPETHRAAQEKTLAEFQTRVLSQLEEVTA